MIEKLFRQMIKRIVSLNQIYRISNKGSFKLKGKQALANIKIKNLHKSKKKLLIIITCL